MQRKRRGKSAPKPVRPSPKASCEHFHSIPSDQRITVAPLSLADFRLLVRSSSAAIACFELLQPFETGITTAAFVSNLYERDSVCVEANDAFLEMIQEKKLENILGASIAELLPKNRHWHQLFSMWHRDCLSSTPLEANIRKQDGDSWLASCALYGLQDGCDLRRIWLVARDISSQAALKSALLKNELHYRSILNVPQRISLRYEPSGLCDYVSASTTSMLGLLRTDRFQRPIYLQDLVHSEDLGCLLTPWPSDETRAMAGPFTIRCRIRDGTFMAFSVRVHQVPSIELPSVAFDLVGDRIDRDSSSLSYSGAVSEASACALHDLNNLLMAAIAQTTCDKSLPMAPQLISLRRTLELCGKLSRTVAAGYPEGSSDSPIALSLQEALNHVIEMIRPLLRNGIQLITDFPENPAILVECTLADMTQVLSNLVLNANDALGNTGTIAISLTSRQLPQQAHSRAYITVQDNGPGISPDILAQLFNQSVSSKPDTTGHGLGLRSVKSIIDRIGGTIIVCSDETGTTVSISLPLVELEKNKDVVPSHHFERPLSILVADDEPLVRQMFTSVLSGLGHTIKTTSDGASLLRTLDTTSDVDVVILDDHMPESRASELAAQLHFQRPGLSIIVASGDPSLRHKMSPVPHTVSFLHKPFTQSEVVAALSAVSLKRRSKGS